jgi:hypothetical protein
MNHVDDVGKHAIIAEAEHEADDVLRETVAAAGNLAMAIERLSFPYDIDARPDGNFHSLLPSKGNR